MLIALILRGVSFEFRAKAAPGHRQRWDDAFFAGSLLAALCQGYMLGAYVLGFDQSLASVLFRSEEHTSELQSLMRISYAVFCLKKKKNRVSNKLLMTADEYN